MVVIFVVFFFIFWSSSIFFYNNFATHYLFFQNIDFNNTFKQRGKTSRKFIFRTKLVF